MSAASPLPVSGRRPGAPFRRGLDLGGIASHFVLGLGALVMLAPFAWMLLTSIRPPEEVFGAGFQLIPGRNAALENYAHAMNAGRLPALMLNGIVVCVGILVVQLVTALPAAYALAKLRFPGHRLYFALVLFGLCVPVQVPALPLYLALAKAGWLDSFFALMLPFFVTVFGIFLFRQFFLSFPDEVIDAARLDGMGEAEILWRIAAPAAAPAIAAFSIFSIVAHWNDLYWPLIVLTTGERATPPIGILAFRDSEAGGNYGALMAGATIITAPLMLLYLWARRSFVRGLTMGAVK